MVSLEVVKQSNGLISSTLPRNLVALFVGATSGIGEATMKKLVQYSIEPRIYFVGRSQEAAARIIDECKSLNPRGEYTFIQQDVSLIRNVDKVCSNFKNLESTLDLLVLSQGVRSLDRSVTKENIHLLAALNYYSRVRFTTNLIGLLQKSTSLSRVLTIGGGSKEGPIDTDDFPALHVPFAGIRGHLTSMITLALETVARAAPEVSFIHDYPGSVMTGLYRDMDKPPSFDPQSVIGLDESGERHVYLATNARFTPSSDRELGVKLPNNHDVAVGTTGETASGVYTVNESCEPASSEVMEVLAGLRTDDVPQKLWNHTQVELNRALAIDV